MAGETRGQGKVKVKFRSKIPRGCWMLGDVLEYGMFGKVLAFGVSNEGSGPMQGGPVFMKSLKDLVRSKFILGN